MSPQSLLLTLVGLLAAADPETGPALRPEEPRFRIEVPPCVLTDVPVKRIVITARDADGNLDPTYNDQPLITGVRLSLPGQPDAKLGAFQNGVLELTTDLSKNRKVFITDSEIVVDPENRRNGRQSVTLTQRWLSLLPPLLAIGLAVWLRSVIVALFAAIWSGAVILAKGDFFTGFVRSLDLYLIGELAQPGQDDKSHMMIVLFTMFLGAMVGVMSSSGGTAGLVKRLSRWTSRREHGQLATSLLGLVVFFDDYANTFLVGGTMRPVTDRLRISREKLAFLVDSTAAPVAGLAVVSTWVGFEVGQIEKAFSGLGMQGDAYTTFLASIPFRFYPLMLIGFVWLVAFSGHDYGPMLRAETRALSRSATPGAESAGDFPAADGSSNIVARRILVRNALIPIGVLLGLIVIGLWTTGSDALAAENRAREQAGLPPIAVSWWSIVGAANSNRVLFLSSFVASAAAVAAAVMTHSLNLRESLEAWADGAKSMLLAIIVLIMAWAVATLCDEDHLNTAGFLVELTRGKVGVAWMPTLAFLLAAAVSFATGSSFATMGLLMPLFIAVTYQLLFDLNEAADPRHHLMLATIGAILAGAIFGDHCSPISDTTVLSSAATDCDHLAHVATQLPYAATVGVASVVFGYLPVGFGYSPLVVMPLGMILLYVVVQFYGQPAEKYVKMTDGLDDLPTDPGDDPSEGKADESRLSKQPKPVRP